MGQALLSVQGIRPAANNAKSLPSTQSTLYLDDGETVIKSVNERISDTHKNNEENTGRKVSLKENLNLKGIQRGKRMKNIKAMVRGTEDIV